MSRIAAILPAAGLGTRMGAETPKQFLELDSLPLVIFTLRRLAACAEISEFLIATLADEEAALTERIRHEKLGRPVRVVRGGGTRLGRLIDVIKLLLADYLLFKQRRVAGEGLLVLFEVSVLLGSVGSGLIVRGLVLAAVDLE